MSTGKTTRARKVEWLGGERSGLIRKWVEGMLIRHGADWLTDEQINEITSAHVREWKYSQRFAARNRRVIAARRKA